MNKLKKYNSLLAFAFFVLYLFIVTPRDYWHIHECNAVGHSIVAFKSTTKTVLEKGSSEKITQNCAICSQQIAEYASFDFSIVLSWIKALFSFQKYIYLLFSFPLLASAILSNRGPPRFFYSNFQI